MESANFSKKLYDIKYIEKYCYETFLGAKKIFDQLFSDVVALKAFLENLAEDLKSYEDISSKLTYKSEPKIKVGTEQFDLVLPTNFSFFIDEIRKIPDIVSEEYSEICEYLKTDIYDRVSALNASLESIKSTNSGVYTIKRTKILALISKVEEKYKRLTFLKRVTEDLRGSSLDGILLQMVRSNINLFKEENIVFNDLLVELNDSFPLYVTSTKNTVKTFYREIPNAVNELSKILFDFFVHKIGSLTKTYNNKYTSVRTAAETACWKKQFESFLASVNYYVSSRSLKIEPFISYDTDTGQYVPILPSQSYIEAPLFLAETIEDFKANVMNGFPFSKGSLLQIYNYPGSGGVLTQDPVGQKKYIQSSLFKIKEMKVGLVLYDMMVEDKGMLKCRKGEMVQIIGEDPNSGSYLCKNTRGSLGKIHRDFVIVEVQKCN